MISSHVSKSTTSETNCDCIEVNRNGVECVENVHSTKMPVTTHTHILTILTRLGDATQLARSNEHEELMANRLSPLWLEALREHSVSGHLTKYEFNDVV